MMGSVQNGDEEFLSETFLVNTGESTGPTKISCRWRSPEPTGKDVNAPQYFHSLDLLLNITPTSSVDAEDQYGKSGDFIPFANNTSLESLVHACSTIRASRDEAETVAKVVLPPQDGFLCRNDIFELRMRHSEFAGAVISFPTLDGRVFRIPPPTRDQKGDLLDLLSSSPGAVIAKPQTSHHEGLEQLSKDLEARLSFDWILPAKPAARTVAVVGGRPVWDMRRGSYGSQGPFEAAWALGISVIVLDRPGHWLQGDEYAYLRDEFIAIDVTNDADVPANIVEAVRGRNIHGIVTFSDEFVIATAKAAELLHLPTEPMKSILQAHYKDETREIINSTQVQVLRLNGAQQLDDPAMAGPLGALAYPLIAKPCRGGASRGVKKVHDRAGLRQAVRQMEEDGLARYGILVETYVDGPEVDANLVLWDGELLFSEISDDFPCQADAADATLADNFAETLMVLPSGLRAGELQLLTSSLHQSLLRLGFRTGVFHVEARVQSSSMRYEETGGCGILDLTEKHATAAAPPSPRQQQPQPSAFLIEVNARPPGLDCVWSTLYTYGVDFCALHWLRALGDRERYAALTKPFAYPAQYWCGNSQVPIHRDNILVPDDFFEQVLQRLPDVAPHVSRAEFFTQPRTVVSPRLGVGFIAYFMLYSRKSRRHVLEMSARVQEVSKDVLDGVGN